MTKESSQTQVRNAPLTQAALISEIEYP